MAYDAVKMKDWQISEAAEKNMPTSDEWREKLGLQKDEIIPYGRLCKLDFMKIINRLKDKAFFMAFGLYKPHLPFNAPKKYWDMYDRAKIKLADNPFLPKNCPTYAPTNWGALRNYYGIPKKGPCSEDLARELTRKLTVGILGINPVTAMKQVASIATAGVELGMGEVVAAKYVMDRGEA